MKILIVNFNDSLFNTELVHRVSFVRSVLIIFIFELANVANVLQLHQQAFQSSCPMLKLFVIVLDGTAINALIIHIYSE
jgi:hypothetical protein